MGGEHSAPQLSIRTPANSMQTWWFNDIVESGLDTARGPKRPDTYLGEYAEAFFKAAAFNCRFESALGKMTPSDVRERIACGRASPL